MVGDLNIRIAKLSFHAKESPFRTRDGVLSLVSSRSNSLDEVYSPVVRGPPNPRLPQEGRGSPSGRGSRVVERSRVEDRIVVPKGD